MNNLIAKLDQLEAQLKALVEGSLAGISYAGRSKSDLIHRLVAAMRAEIQPQTEGPPLAPNVFTLRGHPTQIPSLVENQGLFDELAVGLERAGGEIGLSFAGPIVLKVSADQNLPVDRLEIVAESAQAPLGETMAMPPEPEGEADPSFEKPFLIVNGDDIFVIERPVVNIGRSPENHLVIDAPQVSRFHAQLRGDRGRFVIFDLNSSGGTFVNDRRVDQRALWPGDVISLAGVPLIFGGEPSSSLKDTQEFKPSP